MLDIVEIVLQLHQRIFRAGPITVLDLRPTRQPWLYSVTYSIKWKPLNQLINEIGALRPRADQAHVTLENVPELWEFIDSQLSQESTDWCDARIVLTGPHSADVRFGIYNHGTELNHPEFLT